LVKKGIVLTFLILINLILLECGSALILYHYWSRQPASRFAGDLAGLATLELGRRIGRAVGIDLPWLAAGRRVTSVPEPFFVPDAELGYAVRPGSYQILIDTGAMKYQFNATIRADGSRATSYLPVQADRRLYIFGDSVTWGWPNQDEHTFAWLLQQSLPDYSVMNFAQNGYGNVQGLIQLRRLRSTLEPDDIVLLIYGNYFNIRNVAAPSRLRQFQGDSDAYRYSDALTHPQAVLNQGKLEIRYLPLLCSVSNGYCDQPDPSQEQMYAVTTAIFDEIIESINARVIVGYTSGPDQGDPVIAFLKQRSIEVIDMRPSPVLYQQESLPFDGHPGPIGQYHYFRKVLDYLQRTGG
jgi:hypothetical protein